MVVSSANSTVHLSNIIRAQYANGRISLPQNGGLFTRLRHVQGVPSQWHDGGYSVSKLRMIDLLVERLVRLKGEHAAGASGGTVTGAETNVDALLNDYAAQVSSALKNAETNVAPSITAGIVESGMLFDLVA